MRNVQFSGITHITGTDAKVERQYHKIRNSFNSNLVEEWGKSQKYAEHFGPYVTTITDKTEAFVVSGKTYRNLAAQFGVEIPSDLFKKKDLLQKAGFKKTKIELTPKYQEKIKKMFPVEIQRIWDELKTNAPKKTLKELGKIKDALKNPLAQQKMRPYLSPSSQAVLADKEKLSSLLENKALGDLIPGLENLQLNHKEDFKQLALDKYLQQSQQGLKTAFLKLTGKIKQYKYPIIEDGRETKEYFPLELHYQLKNATL